MIVCVCKAVSDRHIRQSIADGAGSVEELQIELGVAVCCGRCEPTVRDMLVEAGVCPSAQAATHCAPLTFHREAVPALELELAAA
jgi:bacterioferritin-associated ferredoxin